MRVASLVGYSGSGKTTLIVQLVRHFVARGETVGVIKHTHHPVNHEDRGDTRQFREAGGEPVILAGAGQAVVFRGAATEEIAFEDPSALLERFSTDVVLVEGFRAANRFPQIQIEAKARPSLEELLANLDRIWHR